MGGLQRQVSVRRMEGTDKRVSFCGTHLGIPSHGTCMAEAVERHHFEANTLFFSWTVVCKVDLCGSTGIRGGHCLCKCFSRYGLNAENQPCQACLTPIGFLCPRGRSAVGSMAEPWLVPERERSACALGRARTEERRCSVRWPEGTLSL